MLYFPVFPASATEIDKAENQEDTGVDMFCAPAYCDICLEDAGHDRAVDCVDAEGGEFETECCLGAAGSGNRVEEDHCSYCEKVRTAHHYHRWNSGRDELRDVGVDTDDSFREYAEQQCDADHDSV